MYIRYVRSTLAVMVKSESKRSPRTDFAPGDMQENIRAIFIYIASNFLI